MSIIHIDTTNLDQTRCGGEVQGTSFECHLCKMKFKRKSLLEPHIKTCNTANRPVKTTIACKLCSYVFTLKQSLKKHMDHQHSTEIKEFPCNLCPKVFKQKEYLQKHKKRHPIGNDAQSENYYNCEICKKSCKSKDNLRKHKRTKYEDPKFFCDICKKNHLSVICAK